MRGKRVPIKDLKAECPYCHKINTFEMDKTGYGKLVGAINSTFHCEHLTNWFKEAMGTSTVYARFEKNPEWKRLELQ